MSKLANKLFTRDATRRVPVTVLTGALGSGKSTLVNHILNNKQGAKICVIENEFGQVGIDDSLIADRRGDKKPTPVVSVQSLNLKKNQDAANKAQGEKQEEDDDLFKIVNPEKQHIALEDELVVMLNGCICCTVRQDLVAVLKRLLITEKHPIDAIVIETTGLADPAPVAQTFFVDPDVSKVAYLDAIITVVDAFHVRANMDRERPEGAENEIVEQLAFADRVILNKIDLLLCTDELEGIANAVTAKTEAEEKVVPANVAVDVGAAAPPPYRSQAHGNHTNGKIEKTLADAALLDAQTTLAAFNSGSQKHVATDDESSHEENKLQQRVAELARCIRGINPLAEIIASIGSVVPLEKVVGLNAFSLDRVQELDPEFLETGKEHVHDDTVGSIAVVVSDPVSMPLLEMWIRKICSKLGSNLYRYKGVIHAMGVDERVVFQGVSMLFRAEMGLPWRRDEKRESKFIFIGKNLALEELKRDFLECIAKPLRFAVGTKVLASCDGGLQPGVILAQWDDGNAYRIRLDKKHVEVWAPIDIDNYVRLRQ